jgi:anti-repressor protein
MEVKRGDIFYADLGEGVGHELTKIRPVVILLDNSTFTPNETTIIIAPITSNTKDCETHVFVSQFQSSLEKDSAIMIEQIRTIDVRRLRQKIWSMPSDVMAKVDEKLDLVFRRETKEKRGVSMEKLSLIENGIIPVYQSEKGSRLVNMRELHAWLGVGRDFSNWIKDRIEKYGFIENQDYILFANSGENSEGRPRLDYIFKLEPAKEIAMVENNEKGKEIRRYFIAIEEKYKLQMPQSVEDLIILQAQSMKQLKAEVKQLSATTQTIKDTIITQPDNWREDINRMLNKIAETIGQNKYQEVRRDSYKLLEQRARVDLERRLDNLKGRLLKEGLGKTAINEKCKLDVIDADPKLREIYGKIVAEYTVKFIA